MRTENYVVTPLRKHPGISVVGDVERWETRIEIRKDADDAYPIVVDPRTFVEMVYAAFEPSSGSGRDTYAHLERVRHVADIVLATDVSFDHDEDGDGSLPAGEMRLRVRRKNEGSTATKVELTFSECRLLMTKVMSVGIAVARCRADELKAETSNNRDAAAARD